MGQFPGAHDVLLEDIEMPVVGPDLKVSGLGLIPPIEDFLDAELPRAHAESHGAFIRLVFGNAFHCNSPCFRSQVESPVSFD
jgi:hypothetical protein